MKIVNADIQYLNACADILAKTELGQKYFLNPDGEYIGEYLLKEGFDKKQIYVAIDENNKCYGFSWIEINGIFHWFPFLHVIVTDPDFAKQGIGSKLMDHFENLCFEIDKSDKAFLIVASYNEKAVRFYENRGYLRSGIIPDLYFKGIDEILMYKNK